MIKNFIKTKLKLNKNNTLEERPNKNVIITMMICLVVIVVINIHNNKTINKIIVNSNSKIKNLEEYNNFMAKDVDTYKTLYNESSQNEAQLKNQFAQADKELKELKSKTAISTNISKQISRGGYANKDLTKDFAITTDQLNEWISKIAPKNSPFIGKGDVFIEAAKETGLDPKYIVAHAALESSWGTSDIAREKHNYFGINAVNADPNRAYTMADDLRSGIINGAKWIKDNYISKGKKSLNEMIYKGAAYCQNDDGTPSQSWIDQIVNIVYNGEN